MLDRAAFDAVLGGWLEAAGRGLLQAAVIRFDLRSTEAADALAQILQHCVRSVDVIGRGEPTSIAVVIDADAEGVARCIERVREVAELAQIEIEVSVTTTFPW